MMATLFSSFDPSTNWNFSMNWLSLFLGVLIVPPMYWMIPSRWNMTWIQLINMLHIEFKILSKSNTCNKNTMIFISLFALILFNNFLGIFPYIFTCSSHMSFSLSLSVPLWVTFMLYGWLNNTIHMFTHLTPEGAPNSLLPFLILIETVSNLVRPGALAIRLTANMIAGHLLLTLLGNSGSILSSSLTGVLILVQILLLALESAVTIIQSYVFSILTMLYSSEVA